MAEQDTTRRDVLPGGTMVADRFQITGTLGKGAMGAVYAAAHAATGQKVALKFMAIGGDVDPEFVARFEREGRIMASLRHPNTIRIYDFGRDAHGDLFMAMEMLEGEGLDARIRDHVKRQTALDEAETLAIGIQICKSLQEAHATGLVHRDMKPGNVFVTTDGSGEPLVKVLDFGIAQVNESALTLAGRIMGTPTYMSPEQWQGAQLDARSDLYAVGCILFACLAGRTPFLADGNIFSLQNKHINEAPPDLRALARQPVSDGFVAVVNRALAKRPDQRFADAKAMRLALEAVAAAATTGNLPLTDPDATMALTARTLGTGAAVVGAA